MTKEGSNEFLFKVGGHKHTFQATSAAERDSWVLALETKVAEAKAEKEAITSSEGYKAELEKLTKPAVVTKKTENKEETAKEDKTEEAKKEEKAAAKSRSQSRKRASIFGSLLGKKEETAEEKKEEQKTEDKKEATEENKAAEPASSAEPAAAVAATETAEGMLNPLNPLSLTNMDPVAAPTETTEEAKKEEPKEEKKEEKKAKRASIFGSFFQKVASPSHEKTEKEATAPAEENAVSTSAPQLENPVEEAAVKPIEPESVTAPADAEAAKDTNATAETPTAEAATSPKDKRRTSFFGAFGAKKEKKAETSDNEVTDGETKKSNKLGGLFRKPSKGVKLDKEEVATTQTEAKADKAEETVAQDAPVAAVEETPNPVEPAVPASTEEAKNVNVATSTPVQAAA